jgi:hypothetical protein
VNLYKVKNLKAGFKVCFENATYLCRLLFGETEVLLGVSRFCSVVADSTEVEVLKISSSMVGQYKLNPV